MSPMYNIRTEPFYGDSFFYRIVKFDKDFHVIGIYHMWKPSALARYECSCPAGSSRHCKHPVILQVFLNYNRVNSGWFYDYDASSWERPVDHPGRIFARNRGRER